MNEESDICPYLQIDKVNDEYICKARIHHKRLTPHIARLCQSKLHKTCPDYQIAQGKTVIK